MSSTDIHSTQEIVSIALAAERDAVLRFSGLAGKMTRGRNDDAAALFEDLADNARQHVKKLVEWASLEGLEVTTKARPLSWEDPVVETHYDVQARDPYRCTPYKALAFAVHIKERSFRYYSYVAADSGHADVCHYARILARTELRRAASLRVRRRSAWHLQRNVQSAEPRLNPALIISIADLLAVTVCIEQFFSKLIALAEVEYVQLGNLAVSTCNYLSMHEQELREAGSPGRQLTRALNKATSWSQQTLLEMTDPLKALRRLCADCDRSFAFYDSVVKSASDEALMLLAQDLSALAMERIAELRRITASSSEKY